MSYQIALRNQAGKIVASAIVDDSDGDMVAHHTWYLSRVGYAAAKIDGRIQYLHRWLLGNPASQVDHANRDKLDCRRANMRLVTDAQNKQNVPGRGGTSEHRGVFWDSQTGRWMAAFGNGSKRHRKRFATEAEAAAYITEWRAHNLPFSMEQSPNVHV